MSKWSIEPDFENSISLQLNNIKVKLAINKWKPYEDFADATWCDIWFEVDDGSNVEIIGGEEIDAVEVVEVREFVKDILDGNDPGEAIETLEPYYVIEKGAEDYSMIWFIPAHYPTEEYFYGENSCKLIFNKESLIVLHKYLCDITNY